MGGGLTLDNLLPSSTTEKREPKARARSQPKAQKPKTESNGAVKRRTTALCAFIDVGPHEIRDAHLKAAVFPSEKPEFERMVEIVHGKSVSDLLREYLIGEYDKAKREGKI